MLEYEMQPLKRKRIKLSALARRIVSDVLNEGLEEKYALELEVADRGAIICGDEGLLLRALNNLVHNSIRHNPEGCRILVHTAGSPDRSFCSIRVSDDGKGIPPRCDAASLFLQAEAAGAPRARSGAADGGEDRQGASGETGIAERAGAGIDGGNPASQAGFRSRCIRGRRSSRPGR